MKQNYTTGWLKFWLYFRFPVGLILSLFTFSGAYMNDETLSGDFTLIIAMCIDLAVLTLTCITYYYMYKREKIGYILIKIFLIVELIYISINSTFSVQYSTISEYTISIYMSMLLCGLIWTLPNYVYFLKRRWWFEKKEINETE